MRTGTTARPVTPDALVNELVDLIDGRRDARWPRVAVDGAAAADPDMLADALVEPLRVRGRPVLRVRAADFLRPASLRFERGRTNPDAYYEDWLDLGALNREVLHRLGPGGPGTVLPRLRDAELDRATRDAYAPLPPGGVLLLSGALLLGAGLAVDVTVHLHLSAGALARRTEPDAQWTLPAFRRYAAEVDPAGLADVVVKVDDPRHPALLTGAGPGEG